MKPQLHVFIPSLLILVSIILYSASTSAAQVEFSYIEGSPNGPEHWGDLKAEWAACKNGKAQSPVDLSSRIVKVTSKLGQLKTTYKPQNATVQNRGSYIAVNWKGDAGSIYINGTQFFLQMTHWHHPAEHTINGRRYDMEEHSVHISPQPDGTNKTAVVTRLFKFGSPDPFLSQLEKYIAEIPKEGEEKSVGVRDPNETKPGGKIYYRYIGSLTAPPCTEGVIWTINKKIRTVSREQVQLLVDSLPYFAKRNARPLQSLNGREIQLSVPMDTPHY